MSVLEEAAAVRLALRFCASTLAGKRRPGQRSGASGWVLCNALGYVVEQDRLPSNPVDRIQWIAPAVAETVDRRVVVSPARNLLAAVRNLGDSRHLEAF